jgi:hypothetical protein
MPPLSRAVHQCKAQSLAVVAAVTFLAAGYWIGREEAGAVPGYWAVDQIRAPVAGFAGGRSSQGQNDSAVWIDFLGAADMRAAIVVNQLVEKY